MVTLSAMIRRAALLSLCLLAGLTAVGCSSARTETFDVEVRNNSIHPLTITLAKNGPPYEQAWASPEDLAIETPKLRERRDQWQGSAAGMTMIPPGKSAGVSKVQGRFAPETKAYLRIYTGDLTLSQMLARSAGNPLRLDIQLTPGTNRLIVNDTPGGIKADWVP
jgi:hypothetical protein